MKFFSTLLSCLLLLAGCHHHGQFIQLQNQLPEEVEFRWTCGNGETAWVTTLPKYSTSVAEMPMAGVSMELRETLDCHNWLGDSASMEARGLVSGLEIRKNICEFAIISDW